MLEHATLMELDNVGNQFKSTAELVVNKGIKQKTLNMFSDVLKFDRNNYTDDKIIQILESNGYGYSGDDGYSSSEHLITGTTYYYSSSTGDDDNDGLTPATAKKTLKNAIQRIGYLTNEGDGVLFKRGDVWSAENEIFESLWYTINENGTEPITISCYGKGPLPVFDGMKDQTQAILDNGGWTDNGDGTWYCEPPRFSHIRIVSLKINGVYVKSSFTLDGLLTEDYVTFYSDAANNKLYIKINPNTIHAIEFSDIDNMFNASTNSNNLIYSYLEIKNCRTKSFNFSGNNIQIHNCVIGEGCQHGIAFGGSFIKIYNNLVDGKEPFYKGMSSAISTYPNGGFEGIRLYIKDENNSNVEIYNNTVKNFRHGSIMINGDSTNTPGGVKANYNILYINKDRIDYGGRFAIQLRIKDVEFKNNFMINTTVCQPTGDDNIISDNVFYKNQDSATKAYNTGKGLAWNISYDQGNHNSLVDNNIFYKCSSVGVLVTGTTKGPIDNRQIISNIFYENGQSYTIYPSNVLTGIQIYLNKDNRTYMAENTKVINNVLWSSKTDKIFAWSTEGGLNSLDNYFTINEAENLPYEHGEVVKHNSQFDIAELVWDK